MRQAPNSLLIVSCMTSLLSSIQAVYIGQCIVEIKKELKQENMSIKSNAIAKLLYVSSWYNYT